MPTSPVPHTSASSVSRRSFLHAAGAATLATGFAGAFGSHQPLLAAESVLSPPRAQQAILIHLVGGVSQLETFDPKPHAATISWVGQKAR